MLLDCVYEHEHGSEKLRKLRAFLPGGSVSGGGVPAVELAVGQANPTGIAVDATSVYWSTNTGVMKAPIGGGTPPYTTLASAPGNSARLAVDATNVYWVTCCDATTHYPMVIHVSIAPGGAPTTARLRRS